MGANERHGRCGHRAQRDLSAFVPSLASQPERRARAVRGIPGRDGVAHLHGDGSGSLHVALPREVVTDAIDKGWAEMHPAVRMFGLPSTLVMLYGPRDQGELETLWRLVQTSYEYARGASDAAIGDA